MPTFGDYETVGEPIVVSEDRGRTTTLWKARKTGGNDPKVYCVKCFLAHSAQEEGTATDTLDADWGLEALEAVKHLKKAQSQGGHGLAPILDFGTSPEGTWYISDYYKRGTLEGLIELRGRVDGAALRHVVYELASGCLALQRTCGRSHANLKSGNVLLAGRPRALRTTPLHLIDPLPISLIRAPHLDADDQRGMVELMREVAEVHDLSGIGLIILQLVEGRHIKSAYDYNYPIESTTAWQRLGKDATEWRELCNRLLDPQLSLAETNLAKLAAQYEPSALLAKLPLLAGVAGAVVLIGAIILFWPHGSPEAKYQKAMAAARQDLDAANLPEAARDAEKALGIKPGDPEAKKLSSEIETRTAQYKQDLDAAAQALNSGNLDEADRQTDAASKLNQAGAEPEGLRQKIGEKRKLAGQQAALQQSLATAKQDVEEKRYAQAAQEYGKAATLAAELNDGASKQLAETEKGYATALAEADQAENAGQWSVAVTAWQHAVDAKPGDPRATNGLANAQRKMANLSVQQKYDEAMKAGQDAFGQKNYDNAIAQANVALGLRPGDPYATRMKSDAEAAKTQLATQAAQAQRDANYQRALDSGRAAYQQKDYDVAISQANAALALRPGDTAAGQLRVDAEARKNELATQAVRDANYRRALDLGQAAYQQKDYDGAITQANTALGSRPGDAAAAKLKSDAEARKAEVAAQVARDASYRRTMDLGLASYQQRDYDGAITQAEAALGLRPGDTAAGKLKSDAGARKSELAAQQARDADYQRAMDAGLAAYQQKDYDGAINQANAALGWHPGDPRAAKLKSDAGARKGELAAQETRDANYRQAMDAGQAAYQQKDYDGAITQAGAALGFHPGDPAAARLKADAEARKNELAAQKSRQAGYQQSMIDGQAALSRKDYEMANAKADAALGFRQGDAAATRLKADAEAGRQVLLQEELSAANTAFDQGNYPAALNICNRRPGEADFTALAGKISAEQQALVAAQNRLKAGDYLVIDEIRSQTYASKAPFSVVVTQASQEKAELEKLQQLEHRPWSEVNSEFAQFSQGAPDVVKKPPFAQVRQWLANNDPVRRLDQTLAGFKVCFGLPIKATPDLRDPVTGAKAVKLPITIVVDPYRSRLQQLQKQYTDIGPVSKEHLKDFKDIEGAIDNWNP